MTAVTTTCDGRHPPRSRRHETTREVEHEHTPEAIRSRLAEAPGQSFLRDWIYGGIDGSVTTFAVVTGVAGAELAPAVILILGIANLVGDGFSMAASNYSATRTEREELDALRRREERHIDECPEGEREEVRQIFAGRGLQGDDLERVVMAVTADRESWVRTMLADEYGVAPQVRSPLGAAASTFAAFFVCGTIPLLPFIVRVSHPLAASLVATAMVFFGIGSAKGLWLARPWWRAGAETLAIGAAAAGLAYAAGVVLKNVV
jgi:VIT1/CCC1 family predicted Fe2+/Mn2+ transporter